MTVLPRATKRKASLALAALGIVYGDIGTSPLYALKEVFGSEHHPVPIEPANVLGILSLVFWALIVVVSVKYVGVVLRADNNGEGGIMALMARVLSQKRLGPARTRIVILLGLAGTALFYGDGAITPAISVLSAVEGLDVATDAFKPFIVPLTVVILVALFMVQRHGTATIGAAFGPVMLLWFATLALLGGAEIARNPVVLTALWPGHAVAFLAHHPRLGFFALGAVFLALTGAEALYADMGHFGRDPIRVAWFVVVLPALVINYFGQGALLLADPTAVRNPFYLLAPGWALIPLVILATASTVIASQAVITGVYSMTSQAIQLGYAPRMAIRHTSGTEFGQIYMPAINVALLVAVIALVLVFRSSSNLAAAYGIAVSGTMIITTLFLYLIARFDWRWKVAFALPIFAGFVLIDSAFFAANTIKFADGGWFPIAFGGAVLFLLTTWKRGREILRSRFAAEKLPLDEFAKALESDTVATVPLTAVFLTSSENEVPRALLHNLKHNGVLHERTIVCSVQILPIPRVPPAQRVLVERLTQRIFRVNLHFGFMEAPDVPAALEWCAEQCLDLDPMQTSYFLGRAKLLPTAGGAMAMWRERLFTAMYRNAGTAAEHFRLPPNRVVELGAQVSL
jgi:KUP system potassium uptake protein